MNDFLIDTDYDLAVTGGDIATGNSNVQHQQLLLATFKGEWKEKPTMAVGAAGFLKDADTQGLSAEIKQEFERDGMQVKEIQVNTEKIFVDASY